MGHKDTFKAYKHEKLVELMKDLEEEPKTISYRSNFFKISNGSINLGFNLPFLPNRTIPFIGETHKNMFSYYGV